MRDVLQAIKLDLENPTVRGVNLQKKIYQQVPMPSETNANKNSIEATGVSLVICCYNSALRLNETLECIFCLNIPVDFSCEVILVDNNSTDNTRLVALAAQQKYSHNEINFKVVAEPTPGLTSARRRGVQESKY